MILDLYRMEREILLHQERLGRGHRPYQYPVASAAQSAFRQFVGAGMIRLGEMIQGYSARQATPSPVEPVRFDTPPHGSFGTALPRKS